MPAGGGVFAPSGRQRRHRWARASISGRSGRHRHRRSARSGEGRGCVVPPFPGSVRDLRSSPILNRKSPITNHGEVLLEQGELDLLGGDEFQQDWDALLGFPNPPSNGGGAMPPLGPPPSAP